jgi:dolichol kinase
MRRKRDLLVTNILALLILLAALLAGWREAAAFGLAVLVVMDLMAVLGERWPRRSSGADKSTQDSTEHGQEPLPGIEAGPEHREPDA